MSDKVKVEIASTQIAGDALREIFKGAPLEALPPAGDGWDLLCGSPQMLEVEPAGGLVKGGLSAATPPKVIAVLTLFWRRTGKADVRQRPWPAMRQRNVN